MQGNQSGESTVQSLVNDILAGLKNRLVKPICEENRIITEKLDELTKLHKEAALEFSARLDTIEEKIGQIPHLILTAFSEALNQVNGGNGDHA